MKDYLELFDDFDGRVKPLSGWRMMSGRDGQREVSVEFVLA